MRSGSFRVYRTRPVLQGVAVFEVSDSRIDVLRVLQPDPLAVVLGGEDEAAKLMALREALDTGAYSITFDQPNDPFYRHGHRASFGEVVSALDAPIVPDAWLSRP